MQNHCVAAKLKINFCAYKSTIRKGYYRKCSEVADNRTFKKFVMDGVFSRCRALAGYDARTV